MKLGNVVKAQLLQQTTRAAKLRSPTGRALVLAPFHHEALNTLGNLMPVTYESWTDTRRLYSPEELVEPHQQPICRGAGSRGRLCF